MTRPLSDIPTAELPALVEQGLPVSEYAAETQRRRQPDCVFNVWESGRAQRAYETAHHSAASWLAYNNSSVPPRVTHRIRVFLKGAA